MRRVAMVTGANRGLGRAIAKRLARQDLHVIVTARTEQAAQATADQLTAAGLTATAHQLDVTDPASVVRAMADTGYYHGRLDVLVNAASPGKIDTRLAYGNADRNPEQVADDFVWLATLPDDGPTGCLFHQREQLGW